MKKTICLSLTVLLFIMLIGCGGVDRDLIEAAQREGELIVYGSCDETYLEAACENFEKLYDINVTYQRLSTGEVQTIITEDDGNPSADVWFGGTTDPYNECTAAGLLLPYEAKNAKHLMDDEFRDADGNWYGIYQGILGFVADKAILDEHGLEVPKDWDDLTDPKYQGLIWMSNPRTAGTAKLIINTMVQMKGYHEAMHYFKELDSNIAVYTKSGVTPAEAVGRGEAAIGICFLHSGIKEILNGSEDMELVVPESGTGYEIGATAIFKGSSHENAAKLWIEYALSPACVNLGKENQFYPFLVIDNASQPKEAEEFGLNLHNVIEYDFEDAKQHTSDYVEDFFQIIGNIPDDRFEP
jgi:iron(III) transport system substrate-binding protein